MNAALQCIASSPSLLSLFTSSYYQQVMQQNQVFVALHKTLAQMQKQQQVQPQLMANVLPVFKMSVNQQQDSSELILKLMDELIEHELKLNKQDSFVNKETTAID